MGQITETDLIINPDGSIYHLNLKKEQLSDKIITVGDPGRVYRISKHFDKIDFEMNKREFITHTGTYKDKRITVLSTGMGTDNVEIVMNELDAIFNIDLKTREPVKKPTSLKILRVGTSGSIQEDVKIGSHVMAEYGIGLDPIYHFYQTEMTAFERDITDHLIANVDLPYAPYCIKGSEKMIEQFQEIAQKGNTATCVGFYAPQGRQLRMPIRFPNLIDQLTYFHKNDFWISNLEMETAGYYAMGRMLGHEMLSLNAILANRVTNEFAKDTHKIVDDLIIKVLETI